MIGLATALHHPSNGTRGYIVSNETFETVNTVKSRASASLGRIRLVLYRPAWVAVAILAFAGCLNFASAGRAQAQESMSCEDKCTHQRKVCEYNGSSPELCKYDYNECVKACTEKK
jgi:hypothetical protein